MCAGAVTDGAVVDRGGAAVFLAVRGTRGALGVVGVPIAGYPLPDAFEKNFMVGILSQCGLSLDRWRLQAEKSGRPEP